MRLLLLGVNIVQTVHAEFVVVSADVEVEAESCEGRDTIWRSQYMISGDTGRSEASDVQSKEGESKERLVDPADHDARVLLPVLDIAVVSQGRSHVPSQKTPAHSPDQSQEAVDRDVEIWLEAYAAVQDDGESKSSDGEKGRAHELHHVYNQ
jgi:hypothetical protein